MSDRVPPVSPAPGVGPVRRGGRMLVLRKRLEQYASGGEEPEDRAEAAAPAAGAPEAAVRAQLMGERSRRGLRGGPEVLEQARSTYLQNEYSGRRDRRPRKGLITKTEI